MCGGFQRLSVGARACECVCVDIALTGWPCSRHARLSPYYAVTDLRRYVNIIYSLCSDLIASMMPTEVSGYRADCN